MNVPEPVIIFWIFATNNFSVRYSLIKFNLKRYWKLYISQCVKSLSTRLFRYNLRWNYASVELVENISTLQTSRDLVCVPYLQNSLALFVFHQNKTQQRTFARWYSRAGASKHKLQGNNQAVCVKYKINLSA